MIFPKLQEHEHRGTFFISTAVDVKKAFNVNKKNRYEYRKI